MNSKNNFDLLRLLFAIQVVLTHMSAHADFVAGSVLRHFPGVPAFFFISGFLIYLSYLNSPGTRYFLNRFLRLFPGLFFVSLGALSLALLAKGFDFLQSNWGGVGIWFLSQITIGQAYNPSFFRDIGVGVLNGSLWSITVEILFYIAVPIIVLLERSIKWIVYALTILSYCVYAYGEKFIGLPVHGEKTLFDFLSLTPVVWGWMFGLGIIAAKNFAFLHPHVKHFYFFAIPLVLLVFLDLPGVFNSSGNRLGFVYFVCFAALILYIAFSVKQIPLKFDLSYGVYVWHMPVINLFLAFQLGNSALEILALVFIMACLSWFLVEKPALRFKPSTIRGNFPK